MLIGLAIHARSAIGESSLTLPDALRQGHAIERVIDLPWKTKSIADAPGFRCWIEIWVPAKPEWLQDKSPEGCP